MPKKKCRCNVCKCQNEPIDNRVVNSHLHKYENAHPNFHLKLFHVHVIDECSCDCEIDNESNDATQIAAIAGSSGTTTDQSDHHDENCVNRLEESLPDACHVIKECPILWLLL